MILCRKILNADTFYPIDLESVVIGGDHPNWACKMGSGCGEPLLVTQLGCKGGRAAQRSDGRGADFAVSQQLKESLPVGIILAEGCAQLACTGAKGKSEPCSAREEGSGGMQESRAVGV